MPSFAPPSCRLCGREVVRVTSGKTGRLINLNPLPAPEGTFSVDHEAGRGRVARFVPREDRTSPLWVAHAATCEAQRRKPRRMLPHTLTLGFAGAEEGTPVEAALARTEAHAAELRLDRLADELITEWRLKCRREGWRPVWTLLQPFLGRHGAEIPKPMRDKFSTVVGRKLYPEAARAGDRGSHYNARATR